MQEIFDLKTEEKTFPLLGFGSVTLRIHVIGWAIGVIDFIDVKGTQIEIPPGITAQYIIFGRCQPQMPYKNEFRYSLEDHLRILYKSEFLFETQPTHQQLLSMNPKMVG